MFSFLGQVSLPATGVDVAGYVTAAITALGAVVLVAVGGYFAFVVIRLGLRWARVFGEEMELRGMIARGEVDPTDAWEYREGR